jgi:hypothetical protein
MNYNDRPNMGRRALEWVMRDVLSGMEELSSMVSHRLPPGCQIIRLEPGEEPNVIAFPLGRRRKSRP